MLLGAATPAPRGAVSPDWFRRCRLRSQAQWAVVRVMGSGDRGVVPGGAGRVRLVETLRFRPPRWLAWLSAVLAAAWLFLAAPGSPRLAGMLPAACWSHMAFFHGPGEQQRLSPPTGCGCAKPACAGRHCPGPRLRRCARWTRGATARDWSCRTGRPSRWRTCTVHCCRSCGSGQHSASPTRTSSAVPICGSERDRQRDRKRPLSRPPSPVRITCRAGSLSGSGGWG